MEEVEEFLLILVEQVTLQIHLLVKEIQEEINHHQQDQDQVGVDRLEQELMVQILMVHLEDQEQQIQLQEVQEIMPEVEAEVQEIMDQVMEVQVEVVEVEEVEELIIQHLQEQLIQAEVEEALEMVLLLVVMEALA